VKLVWAELCVTRSRLGVEESHGGEIGNR
jgi:hypothetical protein